MKYFLVFLIIFNLSNTTIYAESNWFDFLTPYRLNIGLTNDQISLITSLDRDLTSYDSDGDPYSDQKSGKAKIAKKEVCHKTTNGNVSVGRCKTRNNDESTKDWYNSPPILSISLDTKPNYIWAGLGYNLGFTYTNIKSDIVDYPIKNEESEFQLTYLLFTPTIFYVFGNKLLGKDGNFSFLIATSTGYTIYENIEIKRTGTGETSGYDIKGGKETSGKRRSYISSSYFEIDWMYLFLKYGRDKLGFKTKFDGVDEDQMDVISRFVKFGFNYYL